MHFLIIGLGSMGQRRVRCLKQLGYNNIVGYDVSKERMKNVCRRYNIQECKNLEEYIKNNEVSGIVVSTPPLEHSKYVIWALENDIPVFSEINLVDDNYEKIINKSKKCKAFLSSTFLYRKDTEQIIKWTKQSILGNKMFYNYHVGQYLPDWHKWESYKDFFISNIKTNGIRELMAIEFPWLTEAFSKISEFKIQYNKISELDIDYPDTLHIIIVHENGITGNVLMDLVSRISERILRIYGERGVIGWDGTPESLYLFNAENDIREYPLKEVKTTNLDDYAHTIIEEPYIKEIKEFIMGISGNKKYKYSYKEDYEILKLIDKVEENIKND